MATYEEIGKQLHAQMEEVIAKRTADLTAQLAAAVERADRAERERDAARRAQVEAAKGTGPLSFRLGQAYAEASRARREAEARAAGMAQTIRFFASVIKSGEAWSPACEEALRSTLAASSLASPPTEACADPDCRPESGWHVIGCPKRAPSPPCTCKMPIGFGRSFKGFMAPDPKCAFHSPACAPGAKETTP